MEAVRDSIEQVYEQRNVLGEIETDVLRSSMLINDILNGGSDEAVGQLLALNEDLLSLFTRFQEAAYAYRLSYDVELAREYEPVLFAIRNDIYRALALYQRGEYDAANRIKQTELRIEAAIFLRFIESSGGIRNVDLIERRANLAHLKRELAWTTALIVGLVFVLSFFLAGILGRNLTKPIIKLSTLMGAISEQDDLTLRAEVHSEDETGRLARSLNTMLDRAQVSEDALVENGFELERRVLELEETRTQLETRSSDLAALADELRLARDEAQAANRAKSNFLANMSHELRTPLNAIIGFSEIMKEEMYGPLGSVLYRGYVEDINDSGQHLLSLINEILDLSKVESGVDELHEENIEVPVILKSVLRLVQQAAGDGGLELELDLPQDLPPLYADERKLKQILVNLLANAIKFTEVGGKVTLRVWCAGGNGFVFQIMDTGIGMAAEEIPKALSNFGQVDSDLNRKYEGSGLGLPLTKALVEQHGGHLDLQSQVGLGTTITVRFPAARIARSKRGLPYSRMDGREELEASEDDSEAGLFAAKVHRL